MMHCLRSGLAFVAPAALLVAHGIVPSTAAGATTILAKTGDTAPTGPGSFASFSAPVLNNAGQVAFRAGLAGAGVNFSSDTALYRSEENAIVQVVREGQAKPIGTGSFSDFLFIRMNDSGNVAFTDGLDFFSNLSTAIYRGDESTAIEIARTGQTLPGGQGVFQGFGTSALSNTDQVAFADYRSSGSGEDIYFYIDGLYRGDGVSTVPIARAVQVAPTGPGSFSEFGRHFINDSGQTAYVAYLIGAGVNSSNDTALYRFDGDDTIQIARSGQAAPTGPGSFLEVTLDSVIALNNSGQSAFSAFVGGVGVNGSNNRGLFLGNGATTIQIARSGQTAPNGPGSFSSFSPFIDLNDAGQAVFRASLSGAGVNATNSSGIYRFDGAATVEIARTGQAAPSGPGSFTNFGDSFLNEFVALNDAGQGAFLAALGGVGVDSSNNTGLFLYDDQLGLLTVARKGDALLGSTITGLSFAASSPNESNGFNNQGQVAYRFSLANGNSGVAIFSIGEAATLTGDFNSDGFVDAADYTVWRDTLGQSGTDLAADADGSQHVDAIDYMLWKDHFGETLFANGGLGEGASVAEPKAGTAALLLVGLVAACRLRRALHNAPRTLGNVRPGAMLHACMAR